MPCMGSIGRIVRLFPMLLLFWYVFLRKAVANTEPAERRV